MSWNRKACFAAGAATVFLIAWQGFRALDGSESTQSGVATAQQKDSLAAPAELEKRVAGEIKPFMETYCFRCHGPKKQEATLDLSRALTLAGLGADTRKWDLVLERLKAHEMPPEGAKQPDAKERAAVIAAVSN